jgi:integrase/recombinase XerD
MEINWSACLELYFAARSKVEELGPLEQRALSALTDLLERHSDESPGHTAFTWAETAGGNSSRKRRVSLANGFLSFASAFDPSVDLVPKGFLPKYRRPMPFILTEEEILRLMEGSSRVRPFHSHRPILLSVLWGLLASTGLRISEALHLQVGDVHLKDTPAYLQIRMAKFGKSRLVPLHPTTAAALGEYARLRRQFFRGLPTAVFFATELGAEFDQHSLLRLFHRICKRVDIQPRNGRYPTFHSFRHTFVVNRITLWSQAGVDVRTWLPNLSVYLGHLNPSETYWYLTATPELLSPVSDSFERFAMEGGIG